MESLSSRELDPSGSAAAMPNRFRKAAHGLAALVLGLILTSPLPGQSLPPEDLKTFRLAIDDFRAQRLNESLARLRSLVRDHPDHFDIQNLLAIVLDLSGSPAEANQHFRRAVELNPQSARARANYGTNLNRLGRPAESVAQFKKTLDLDPNNATANFNLGTIYLSRKEYGKALPWLRKARAVQPEVYENGYQLAFCYFALGDHAGSKRVLDTLQGVPRQRGEFHLLSALNRKALGDTGAETSLREVLELLTDSPEEHARVATLLFSQGMFREALPVLEAAVERFPGSDSALLNLARVEYALGEPDAQQKAERALSIKETSTAHRLLGDILESAGQPVAAASHFQRAVELDPRVESFYALGYFFLRHWNWETAERVFTAGLERFPGTDRLLLGRGAAFLGKGDDSAATREFLAATEATEPPLAGLHLLAQSFTRSEEHFEAAVLRFERFHRDSPEDAWASYYHALARFRRAEKLGSFPNRQSIVGLLGRVTSRDSRFFEAQFLLGEIHFHGKDWKRSAAALEKAVQLDPDHVESRYKFALALRRSGETDRARSEFQVYQRLKSNQSVQAAERMSQTKKLIVEMGVKPGGAH